MRRSRQITDAGWLLLILLAASGGCTPAARPPAERAALPQTRAQTQQASQPAEPGRSPVLLRTALVPDDRPQRVHLEWLEHRETTGPSIGTTSYELYVDLEGMLTRAGAPDNPDTEIRLTFERLHMQMGTPPQPQTMLAYDSTQDKPGQGNPLADLMTHVLGAEVSIRLGPAGRVLKVHGLDARWRKADIIMAPPPLLAAQWAFRDLTFGELLSWALFPPMPASPVRVGDEWELDVPANIPAAARLNSRLRSRLERITTDPAGRPVVQIQATGRIQPAPELLEDYPATLRAVVKSSSHKVTQTIGLNTHSLRQTSERTVEVLLTLKPPAGEAQEQMTIKQTHTLVVERGRDPAPAER